LIGAGNAAKIAEEMKRSQQDSLMKQIFSAVHLKQIDKWITQSGVPATDRPEAIRRLVELGLMAKGENDDEGFTHSRRDLPCSKCICSGCRAQGRQ
jgi:hypothetical protein